MIIGATTDFYFSADAKSAGTRVSRSKLKASPRDGSPVQKICKKVNEFASKLIQNQAFQEAVTSIVGGVFTAGSILSFDETSI
jgi:hypothetical protein